MTILFLNSAREWGGNEKWSLMAADGMARRGHRVFFGCRSPMFRERAGETGVRFVRFPFINNADPVTVILVLAFCIRHRVDVLIPTKQREYLLGGLAALPLRRVKVVARLGIDRPLHNARNRFAFARLFDGVIVNSEAIVEVLGRTPGFDTRLCRVVPNGVAVPELSIAVRQRMRAGLGVGDGKFMICGAGRLAPQKGFDLAVEAFARVHAGAPHACLVIAGEGPFCAEYQALAKRLNVAERVVFTGFRPDVPELLQSADLFWLTSRSEGMPNALLEAMAARRTVIAFDVAGVREVVTDGENGIVVPNRDTGALAERTLELMRDAKRRERMASAALETVQKSFGIGAMVERVEGFLEEVRGE